MDKVYVLVETSPQYGIVNVTAFSSEQVMIECVNDEVKARVNKINSNSERKGLDLYVTTSSFAGTINVYIDKALYRKYEMTTSDVLD